jgi:hypothetical protein
MGRNIWQSDHPVAMLKALRAIVHGDVSVDDALSIVGEEAGGSRASVAPRNASPRPRASPR